VLAFRIGQLPTFGDQVDFFQTAPTTGSGRMLRHEDGMTVPWSLSAIPGRVRRGESFRDETARMFTDGISSFREQILSILLTQMDAGTECGTREICENLVALPHITQLNLE
jgi:hypothetical protein